MLSDTVTLRVRRLGRGVISVTKRFTQPPQDLRWGTTAFFYSLNMITQLFNRLIFIFFRRGDELCNGQVLRTFIYEAKGLSDTAQEYALDSPAKII